MDQFKLRDVSDYTFLSRLKIVEMWTKIFLMVKDVDFKKPMTPKILSDPNHSFVKMLVYVYTMETFIFREMNKASRTKDFEKLKFYGPFASALSFVIHTGNKNKKDQKEEFTVYRGLRLSVTEMKERYYKGNLMCLQGYTSTTLSQERALNFSFKGGNGEVDVLPVLIEIKVKGKHELFFLNKAGLSAYPDEEEVVLQDGALYKVVNSYCSYFERGDLKKQKLVTIVLEKQEDKYSKMSNCRRCFKYIVN